MINKLHIKIMNIFNNFTKQWLIFQIQMDFLEQWTNKICLLLKVKNFSQTLFLKKNLALRICILYVMQIKKRICFIGDNKKIIVINMVWSIFLLLCLKNIRNEHHLYIIALKTKIKQTFLISRAFTIKMYLIKTKEVLCNSFTNPELTSENSRC